MEELELTPAYTGVSDVIHAEEYRPDDAATSAPKATASSSKPFGVATFITGTKLCLLSLVTIQGFLFGLLLLRCASV
jgi:hypothetical protein